jgi:hypothetical protein
MHDLQLVVVVQLRSRPALARDQFAIEFNGDSVRFHAEAVKKSGYCQSRIELAIFAVNDEVHFYLRGKAAETNRQDCARLSWNFLVAVRPCAFICTNTDDSDSEPSSTANTSTASPAPSVTICA